MRCKVSVISIVAFSLLWVVSPVSAHHGASGYDMAGMTVRKGTITEFDWTNPHCQILFDSKDEKGNVEHWRIEAPPPSMLIERNVGVPWTRKAVKPGDDVTVYFHAAKNGSHVGITQKVVLADGGTLWAYPEAQPAQKQPSSATQ